MTVAVPPDLEQSLQSEAEKAGVSPDELVRRALTWYLEISPELWRELADWQRAGVLTWQAVEDSLA